MARREHGFFIPPGYIIVVVVLAVIGGIGYYVSSRNKAAEETLGSGTSVTQAADPAAKINNFYDCFETDGRTYDPGVPNTCTARGKTFKEPTSFTYDNVRGADKLPAGVRGQVYTEAATNFGRCAKANQDETRVPVTQVLSVLGNDWVYVALSCDTSTNNIYQRQPNGSWSRANSAVAKIDCAVVDQYQIPKELFLTSANPDDHDTVCLRPDGSETQIQYTYKPSGVSEEQTPRPATP